MTSDIDWDGLRDAAAKARDRAYAPYSQHPVGAAALTSSGRVVSGCNVENASLGITLCAECGLVSEMVRTSPAGARDTIVAFACVGPRPGPLLPCGRCRQLLHEHGGAATLIDHVNGPVSLGDLLPDAFGPEDIPGHGSS
jgi:cytidine deaminase